MFFFMYQPNAVREDGFTIFVFQHFSINCVQKYVFLHRNTKTDDCSLNKKRIIMRKILIPLFLFGSLCHIFAQPAKDIMKDPIPVAMFQVTYAFELPALDTKDLYGITHSIGGSVVYKTGSNWMFTANGNFITGKRVKGDRISIFGEGITTVDGEIIGGSGSMAELTIDQRVVNGDYQYGYDRMRGGPAFHLETGYLYLSDNRLLNLSVALEVTYARTRDLRDYDFRVFDGVPVGYTDPHKRYNDLYYGIRVTWNIPTYQRQPDNYYYY